MKIDTKRGQASVVISWYTNIRDRRAICSPWSSVLDTKQNLISWRRAADDWGNIAISSNTWSDLLGAFGTDVACQQGTLTPLDTGIHPFGGLAYAQMVKTNFLKHDRIFRTYHFKYPSVLSRFDFQHLSCCITVAYQQNRRSTEGLFGKKKVEKTMACWGKLVSSFRRYASPKKKGTWPGVLNGYQNTKSQKYLHKKIIKLKLAIWL